jgi:hypothetical protein
MGGVSWVLDAALDAISGVVTAGVVVVAGGDVAVDWGRKKRGWGVCWGTVDRLCKVCRRFCDVGSWFEAGGRVVEVVVNDANVIDGGVDVADGGCVGIISGNVAGTGGDGGLGVALSRGVVCVRVSTVEVVLVWVLESFHVVDSASFDAMAFTTSVTSIRRPSSIDTQWP